MLRAASIVVRRTDQNGERRVAVMALKAGLVFLVGYFGRLIAVLLPAIANEAPSLKGRAHFAHPFKPQSPEAGPKRSYPIAEATSRATS
jgi:hypothetical protein